MLQAVKQFIEQHELLVKSKRYLVALSGGADSVALLRMLLGLGYDVEAAHCNFNLRGEESLRDEEFCKNLCQELGVELHIAHFDTKTFADLHKVSIEMAARDLRYNYFRQLLHDLQMDGVCVAHHRDDSVETILLNLVRGTGIEGLTGIAPKNGDIIRPLLCLSRKEILDYLSSENQGFITDSSNLIADVQRNKVRLEVIPLLKELNPAAIENIYRCSQHLTAAQKILSKALKESISKCVTYTDNDVDIDISKLCHELEPETILWHIIKDYGFNSAQAKQIAGSLDAESGRKWTSESHIIIKDRGRLFLTSVTKDEFNTIRIPEPGNYILDGEHKIRIQSVADNEEIVFDRSNNRIYVDAEKVKFPLTLRRTEAGDWFIPFGMKGRKLLSDFLTDIKLNILEKSQQLVLTDSNGDIIWLPQRRTDNRFRITPETTTLLKMEILV